MTRDLYSYNYKTPTTALSVFRDICQRLSSSGIEDAPAEAELILSFATGLSRVALYSDNPELSDRALKVVEDAVRRRLRRVPLQYVIGEVEFLSLTIKVGPGVLIPRPETELLVLEVLELFREGLLPQDAHVLDIGTGSGCIGLAIARMVPSCHVTGVDVSATAIDYARKNRNLNGVKNFYPLLGSLFEPVKGRVFDLIVSNPPYIRTNEIAHLQKEVSGYEPVMALDGGRDGLDFYRMIISGAAEHLAREGVVVLEAGAGQAESIAEIAKAEGFSPFRIRKDLSSIERVLIFRRR